MDCERAEVVSGCREVGEAPLSFHRDGADADWTLRDGRFSKRCEVATTSTSPAVWR